MICIGNAKCTSEKGLLIKSGNSEPSKSTSWNMCETVLSLPNFNFSAILYREFSDYIYFR